MAKVPARRASIRRRRARATAGIVAWGLTASVLVLLAPASTAAALVVVSFVLIAPGLATVLLLRLSGFALNATIVILAGMAAGALVPSTLLYASLWSPHTAFLIIFAGTLALLVAANDTDDAWWRGAEPARDDGLEISPAELDVAELAVEPEPNLDEQAVASQEVSPRTADAPTEPSDPEAFVLDEKRPSHRLWS